VIAEALASARCVVVVWSRDSVGSSWVREEADEGRKRGVLIPVLIDEVNPPLGFGRIQAARMIEWDRAPESEAFQKLAADVTAVIGAHLPGIRRPTPPRRRHENMWRLLRRRSLPGARAAPPHVSESTGGRRRCCWRADSWSHFLRWPSIKSAATAVIPHSLSRLVHPPRQLLSG
jgi:hypothetical protein